MVLFDNSLNCAREMKQVRVNGVPVDYVDHWMDVLNSVLPERVRRAEVGGVRGGGWRGRTTYELVRSLDYPCTTTHESGQLFRYVCIRIETSSDFRAIFDREKKTSSVPADTQTERTKH